MSDKLRIGAIPGLTYIRTFPADITDMKVIRDTVVVECSNGVAYLVLEDEIKDKP